MKGRLNVSIMTIFFIIIILKGGTMVNAKEPTVTLVANGKPKSVIILSDQPTRSAQLAAKELQEHIRVISGANLPIIHESGKKTKGLFPIYVGESGFTRSKGLTGISFSPQESLIKITPEFIIFLGRDDLDLGPISYEKNGAWPGIKRWGRNPFYRLGTLYSVYDFLEKFCGVRWYMVTDLGRIVPQKTTITVKTFESRNRPWSICRDSTRNHWQIPGEIPVKRPMTPASERDNNLFMFRSRIGGEPFRAVHSVTDYYKRFGEKHPDWFVGKPGPHVQLRYDNPEVIEQVARDAKTFFSKPFSIRKFGTNVNVGERQSRGDFFAVVPHDNRSYGEKPNPPLQPSRRQKGHFGNGVASNYIFTWVNNVAKKVGKEYPDQWISTIAYAGMFEPPDFPMQPNVAVQVCMADGWQGYGLDILKQWREKASRIYTWEYLLDNPSNLPKICPHALGSYINKLALMGVEGMFIEPPAFYGGSVYKNPALYHLNHYITFRALRERGMNTDAVLDEYFSLFYGPARKPMKKFWTIMEGLPKYQKKLAEKGRYYKWATPEFEKMLKDLEDLLDQSEKLALKDPYAARLKLIRKTVLGVLKKDHSKYAPIAKAPVPQLKVKKVSSKPLLDGKLDDQAWKNSLETQAFVKLNGKKAVVTTKAKIIRDDKNLYVGITCDEPFMEKLILNTKFPSPGLCNDDSIEIFIGGNDFKEPGYLQIVMNAEGLIWYHWPGKFARLQTLTHLGVKGAAHKAKDKWCAEIAIPLKSISATAPEKGFTLGMGIYRNRQTIKAPKKDINAETLVAWSPTFVWSFHETSRFGKIIFE